MSEKRNLADYEYAYYVAASMIADFNVPLRTAAGKMNVPHVTLWRYIKMDHIIPKHSYNKEQISLKIRDPELRKQCRDLLEGRVYHHGFVPIKHSLPDNDHLLDYCHIKIGEFYRIRSEVA